MCAINHAHTIPPADRGTDFTTRRDIARYPDRMSVRWTPNNTDTSEAAIIAQTIATKVAQARANPVVANKAAGIARVMVVGGPTVETAAGEAGAVTTSRRRISAKTSGISCPTETVIRFGKRVIKKESKAGPSE